MYFTLFVLMFPMLFAPLILQAFIWFGAVPPWYQFLDADLFGIYFSQIVIVSTFIVLIAKFSKRGSSHSRKKIQHRFLFALIFVLAFSAILHIDLRELAQSNRLNILFNVAVIFSPLSLFIKFRPSTLDFVMKLFSIMFLAVSGSKASIFLIILYYIYYNDMRSKYLYVLFLAFLTGLFVFDPIIGLRFTNQGLSMLNAVAICTKTNSNLFLYYAHAFASMGGYNPTIAFYNDTGYSAGYNITPTVVGDIACGNTLQVMLQALLVIITILIPVYFLNKLFRNDVLTRHLIFYQIMALQSTYMDLVKFGYLAFAGCVLLAAARARQTHMDTSKNRNLTWAASV